MKKTFFSGPNEADKLIDNFVANCNWYNENPSDNLWNTLTESFLEFVEHIRLNPMPTKFYNLSVEEVCGFFCLCEDIDTEDDMCDAMNSLLYLITKIK